MREKAAIVVILLLSLLSASIGREVLNPDGDAYLKKADSIYFDHRVVEHPVYPVLVALVYPLVGHTLLALHFFPFLAAVFSPLVLYCWLQHVFTENRWALLGTLIYIIYPTNRLFINNTLALPVFVFLFLCGILAYEKAKNYNRKRKFLIALSVLFFLMALTTRYEGRFIILGILADCLLLQKLRNRKMFAGGESWCRIVSVLFLLAGFTISLPFIVSKYYGTFSHFLKRLPFPEQPLQLWLFSFTRFASLELSFRETLKSLQYFYHYYLAWRAAPLLLVFLIWGMLVISRRLLYPLTVSLPWLAFVSLLYWERSSPDTLARHLVMVTPFFSLFLTAGIKRGMEMVHERKYHTPFIFLFLFLFYLVYLFYPKLHIFHFGITLVVGLLSLVILAWFWWISKRKRRPVLLPVLSTVSVVSFLTFCYYAFARTAELDNFIMRDFSTRSHIVTLVKHPIRLPVYSQRPELAQYAPSPHIYLREEVVREFFGRYRDGYLIEKAGLEADFFYHEDFLLPASWQEYCWQQTGDSPLFTERYPGLIGAFPYGKSGTIIFRFLFLKPVKRLTLGDRHTRWREGDIIRMWISFDGDNWHICYDEEQNQQVVNFYKVFEQELENTKELYLKYYFYAGDEDRPPDDNGGASLRELWVAVDLPKSNE